jgi:methyl-accepting chemotaxis protein
MISMIYPSNSTPFDPQEFTMIGWIVTGLIAVIGTLIVASILSAKKHSDDVTKRLSQIDTTLQLHNAKYDSILEKISETGNSLNEIFRTINQHGRAIARIQTILKINEHEKPV